MDSTRIRVLLIEDDEEDYLITSRLLATVPERRFEITWAPTLAAGIALAAESPLDAVLLDLSLPDSMGWDTFLQIRRAAPALPIILLTGLQDELLGMRAVHEGAQDYLVKGHLESHALTRSILYAIERKRIEDRLKQVVDELRLRNEELAADLLMAREVQQSLITRHPPVVADPTTPGHPAVRFTHIFRPCQSVGGDFFCVFPLTPGTAGVFVADVMGHGMRSALVAAILRGMLEELRPVAADPGHLMTRLNSAFTAVLRQPGQLIFSSAVYVVLDVTQGTACGVNAGHPRPLILSAVGEAIELAFPGRASGAVLGIEPSAVYETTRWTLSPGDRIALFTDGLTEAVSADGEEFGLSRLKAALLAGAGMPLATAGNRILEAVESFASVSDFSDDVCLLVAEYQRRYPEGKPQA